jgi:SAM-dependent methyltransferase
MRESDIRPVDLEKELDVYLAMDRELWLSGKDFFIRVACPACGSTKTKDPHIESGMPFETCADCETVFHNPRPTVEQLCGYYEKSNSYVFWAKHIFPKSEASRRENIVIPFVERILKYVSRYSIKTGVFLEVGAGFGILSEEIKKRNIFKKVVSIEPTPDLASQCRYKGLEVVEDLFENTDLADESVNCIVASEVIEHVFSPHEFVHRAWRYLAPEGLLMLTCPNIKGFDFMVLGKEKAPNFGLGHINMFHPASIRILLGREGFGVLDILTPGKLDADIVRNQIIKGVFSVDEQPFLKRILIDEWERLAEPFQRFLSENLLSSHMFIVAQKKRLLE